MPPVPIGGGGVKTGEYRKSEKNSASMTSVEFSHSHLQQFTICGIVGLRLEWKNEMPAAPYQLLRLTVRV